MESAEALAKIGGERMEEYKKHLKRGVIFLVIMVVCLALSFIIPGGIIGGLFALGTIIGLIGGIIYLIAAWRAKQRESK